MKTKKKDLQSKLEEFFVDIEKDLPSIKIQKISRNKSIYKPGESLTSLYYVLSGNVSLTIHDKTAIFPSGIFLGDYEVENQHPYRTTYLVAVTTVEVAILPFDFYFSIKGNYISKQSSLGQKLKIANKKLKYCLKKICVQKIYYRGQVIKFEKGDFGIISQGIFKQKKFINLSYMRKEQTLAQKQFELSEVGEGQFVQGTLICSTPKGILYVCKNEYLRILIQDYEQIEKKLCSMREKKGLMEERQNKIKKIVSENKEIMSSFLPPILISTPSPEYKKKSFRRKISQQSIIDKEQIQQENHFLVERTEDNEISSKPTFKNLSLIPQKRVRKSHSPSSPKKLWSPIKALKINQQKNELSQKSETIPSIFENKFNLKMFIKASNPFHHHRSVTEESFREMKPIPLSKSVSQKKENTLKTLKLSFQNYI